MVEQLDWKSVEGFPNEIETERIIEFAEKRCQEVGYNKLALEIGSYRGQSAVALAPFFTLICIDPFGDLADSIGNYETIGNEFPSFIDSMKRFKLIDRVFPVISSSQFLDPPIPPLGLELALLDGNHSYESTIADAERVHRHLNLGAYLFFHDFQRGAQRWPEIAEWDPFPGVAKAAREFLANHEGEYVVEDHFYSVLTTRKLI